MLAGLYIYPIKSLRGISLTEARIENGRIAGDRDWVLVDEAGRFMHQRDYPRMARLDVEVGVDSVHVYAKGLAPLALRYPAPHQMPLTAGTHVELWRRSAPVRHVSRDADAWFTEALEMPCRLMAFLPNAPALNVPDYEVHSSLQDATPFHLTTEESLADLNRRIAAPIPMIRFRPNLVVRGFEPYAEDRWLRLQIGETTLRWIKPCTRCSITMTDHLTGLRESNEPLRALSRYRRYGSHVVFGHYLVADEWGPSLRVGEPVSVLEIAAATEPPIT